MLIGLSDRFYQGTLFLCIIVLQSLCIRMATPQFITAVVYLLVGFLTVKYPAKKINPLYGYRTKRSMCNQEAWDYAQRVSSRKIILVGLVMGVIAFTEWMFQLPPSWCAVILIASVIGSAIYMISSVEDKLRRKFKESEYPEQRG